MLRCTCNFKIVDVLALSYWLFLAGVHLSQAWQFKSLISLLLVLQSGLVAYFLTKRADSKAESPFYQELIAWLSALSPLALQVGAYTHWIAAGVNLTGLALAVWSLFSLGKSFGIAPADRGLVREGPYRLMRHPMYAGELLALVGATWGRWSAWNIAIFSGLLVIVLARIRWEERLLSGYTSYAHQVRWRLLPGIW